MKFFDNKHNITQTDANIRFIIAALIGINSMLNNFYWMLPLSLFLVFTAVNKSCFFYHLFKINDKLRMQNLYISYLPKYNPLPVFIFDSAGKMLFQNEASKVLLPEVVTISDIGLHNNHDRDSIVHYYGRKAYKIDAKYVYNIDVIFVYVSDVTEMVKLNREIEKTQVEVINLMGSIGETRSRETGNHVKRVAEYSYLLASKYGLSDEEAKLIFCASPMHDIGKVGIPDSILNKPGKLTKDEFEIMKTHARLGYEMLAYSKRPILKAAAIIAHEHHEKYDGSGYPKGLKGEDIHIYGRITAVADVFDALGSERVYKKAWSLEKIVALFKAEQGKHFDPVLVDILLNNLDDFLAIRDRYQDEADAGQYMIVPTTEEATNYRAFPNRHTDRDESLHAICCLSQSA